jgi:hypothetical protein
VTGVRVLTARNTCTSSELAVQTGLPADAAPAPDRPLTTEPETLRATRAGVARVAIRCSIACRPRSASLFSAGDLAFYATAFGQRRYRRAGARG